LEEVRSQMARAAESWVDLCLDEPRRGMKGLLEEKKGYLHHMTEHLKHTFLSKEDSECARRLKRAQEDAKSWRALRDAALDEIVAAVSDTNVAILRERPFTVSFLTERLKDAETQYAYARVEETLYALCSEAGKHFGGVLSDLAADLPQFHNDVDGFSGKFSQTRRALLDQGDGVLFIRIFDEKEDWPDYYQLNKQPVAPNAEAAQFQTDVDTKRRTLRAVTDYWRKEGAEKLRLRLAGSCDNRFTRDFRENRRDKDVLKHPKVRSRNKQTLAGELVDAALSWAKREEVFAGRQVEVVREAYLGIAGGNEATESAEFARYVQDKLAAYRYKSDEFKIQKTDSKSEIYLYTVNYAFPLPVLRTVSDPCHTSYYNFYSTVNDIVGRSKEKIPVHIDSRWEGLFEDLVLVTGDDAETMREAIEVLLFGSLLKVLVRRRKDSTLKFGYVKRATGRQEDVLWGNRRESIEELRKDSFLRDALRDKISELEQGLSTNRLKAYCYAMTYLTTRPEFEPGTAERNVLDAKYLDTEACWEARQDRTQDEKIETLPSGLDDDGVKRWITVRTGDSLEWLTGDEFAVLVGEYWVQVPARKREGGSGVS